MALNDTSPFDFQSWLRNLKSPAVASEFAADVDLKARFPSESLQSFREERLMSVAAITRIEQTHTAELLEDAMAIARLRSDAHPMLVRVDAAAERTDCDPVLTRLALSVLAENAVKYTPPGTAIRLTARAEQVGAQRSTVLEVADEGPGVSPDELAKLFEPGYRGVAALTTDGSGLGLTLARRLIELQGGTLTLHSEPGLGFTGTIRLKAG